MHEGERERGGDAERGKKRRGIIIKRRYLLNFEREDVILADGEDAREVLGVLLDRVEVLEELGEVALKVAPLPRRAVGGDLAVVPPRGRAALPVALVVDQGAGDLERQVGRQQLGHPVDVPRRDAAQRRPRRKVGREHAHAELRERRRHVRAYRVLVVEAGEVEFDGHGGGANTRGCAAGGLATSRRQQQRRRERLVSTHEEARNRTSARGPFHTARDGPINGRS